jgi:hypothetical protein
MKTEHPKIPKVIAFLSNFRSYLFNLFIKNVFYFAVLILAQNFGEEMAQHEECRVPF